MNKKAIALVIAGVSVVAIGTSAAGFVNSQSAPSSSASSQTLRADYGRDHHEGRGHHDWDADTLSMSMKLWTTDEKVVTVETVFGTIASSSDSTLTIALADESTRSLSITDTTRIWRDGLESSSSELLVSDAVAVQLQDGVLSSIAVSDEAPGKPHRGRHMDSRIEGTPISRTTIELNSDGTLETEVHFHGIVSAINGTSVTVEFADGTTQEFSLADADIEREFVSAAVSDLVVGDHIKVDGEVVADVIVVDDVHVVSAETFAQRPDHRGHGMRGGHGSDFDGPAGRPGHHGRGHHGPGHMDDSDVTAPTTDSPSA